MPAALTENFFYTNIDDCLFMLSDEGMDAIADVHVQGIKMYCEKYLK
jgi:N-acetylmuramoyl-L-alanine amidase